MAYGNDDFYISSTTTFTMMRAALGLSIVTFVGAVLLSVLIFTMKWLNNGLGKRLKPAVVYFTVGALANAIVLALTVALIDGHGYADYYSMYKAQLAFNIINFLFAPTAVVMLFVALMHFAGVATHGENRGKMRMARLVLAVFTEVVIVAFFAFYAAACAIREDHYGRPSGTVVLNTGLFVLAWMRLGLILILALFAFVRCLMIPSSFGQGRGHAIATSVMLVSHGVYNLAITISAGVSPYTLWHYSQLASYVLDFVFGIWPILAGLGIMGIAGKHLDHVVFNHAKAVV